MNSRDPLRVLARLVAALDTYVAHAPEAPLREVLAFLGGQGPLGQARRTVARGRDGLTRSVR